MIARIWRGAVLQREADAYAQYMGATGVPAYSSTPGNRGAWMLRRDVGEHTEFVMFTLWDSLDAVKGFAGDKYQTAVSIRKTIDSWWSAISRRRTMRSQRRPFPAR